MATKTSDNMSTIATISGTKIELLNHENYFSWAPRARAICKKEGQWKYIDPAKQSSKYEDLTDRQKEACEDAKDWLELMISDEVVQDLIHLRSGAEVWTFLEDKYTRMQASQQTLYLQRLESVVFDDQKEELQGYINRISRLVAQVRSCKGVVSEVGYSGYLLRGLPPSYDMIKVVLNAQRGTPETVKHLLLSEEARLKEEAVRNRKAPIALSATTGATSGGPTGGLKDGKGRKRKCYHCGKEGHIRKDCFKLKAEEAESKKDSRVQGTQEGCHDGTSIS